MSRYKYQDVVRDGNGVIISSATVSVYLAGTTTAASIYTASSGGTAVHSVTSGSDGVFYFYVDVSDYPTSQAFKLIISHNSFDPVTIDNMYLSDLTYGQIIASEGSASGIATLNASSKVVQEPASKAQASGIASLDSNSRLVQPALTLYDGVGNRSASPTSAANTIPVANASGSIPAGFGGTASSLATLNASTRLVEPALTLYDGSGNRSASSTPGAYIIPVCNSGGTIPSGFFGLNNLIWSKTVSGSAVTTLTSPTLDLATAYAYDFILIILNTTVSNVLYSMYYNNNTTATDYRRNYYSGESNDAVMHYGNIPASGKVVLTGTIMQSADGYVSTSIKTLGLNSSSTGTEAYPVMHWKVTAVSGSNLTRVDFTGSVSSSIGINSSLKVWERNGFGATTSTGTTS